MALTVSSLSTANFGSKNAVLGNIAFDSSYAYGGESFTASNVGLSTIERVIIEPLAGYSFEYDHTNAKIKAYTRAPAIVYGEGHTIASNQITLDYPAAAIINIASGTQSQMLIEPSDTLAANEVQLAAAMTAGTRPTLTFHASTSGAVWVTYITQAWKEVWDARVASTDYATTSHVASLGAVAVFVESCLATGTTGSSRPRYLRGGDAAGTLECEIDFTDAGASDLTTMTFFATDAITSAKVTYIAQPASGFLVDNFVEDEDLTMSSGTGASAYPILFPSLCGQIPDYTAAAERDNHYLGMREADALGTAGEFAIDWHKLATVAGHQIRTNDTTSDALSLTYVKGFPFEIPGLVPLEVRNATDLSDLTAVKFTCVGY